MDINNDKILVSDRKRSPTAKWVEGLIRRMMFRLIPSSLLVDCSFYNFQNAITACYFADRNLVVRRVNQTFRSLFPGNTNYEGRLLPAVLEEIGCHQGVIQDFQDQLREKKWVSIPEVTVSTNGETRYFSLFSTSTAFEGISTLTGLQGQFIDRTDEVLLKIKLQQAMQRLQDTQNQLIMKEKMASLGNLVAGVAHEINNPIGAVNASADVVIRATERITTLLEKRQVRELEAVETKLQKSLAILMDNAHVLETAGERISCIVKSLKNFARLDEAEKQIVDIHEGLDNTLILINHELKNRITVRKAYGAVPPITCYPNQLNQVFMNVLLNAANAITGEGVITVTTRHDAEHLYIDFSDTGTGIALEHLTRVFDPGFKTKGVGTGLGLSISYNIIKKHAGDIQVSSVVGEGSTFTISLPLDDSA